MTKGRQQPGGYQALPPAPPSGSPSPPRVTPARPAERATATGQEGEPELFHIVIPTSMHQVFAGRLGLLDGQPDTLQQQPPPPPPRLEWTVPWYLTSTDPNVFAVGLQFVQRVPSSPPAPSATRRTCSAPFEHTDPTARPVAKT